MLFKSTRLCLEEKMRYGYVVLLSLLVVVACEKFPVNPPKMEAPQPAVYIRHVGTDYVPAEVQVEGIIANKVNVLSFEIRIENFTAKSLEFYGIALLEGPPEWQEHAIHFRTDIVSLDLEDIGYTFSVFEAIQSGAIYTLNRAKFPTNEYSPFDGTQGKILSLSLTEAWSYDESGRRESVKLIQSE
jgi:hypothetical protein